MNSQDVQYEWEDEVPPEYLYGVHIKLDGGEVDRTVRPRRALYGNDSLHPGQKMPDDESAAQPPGNQS